MKVSGLNLLYTESKTYSSGIMSNLSKLLDKKKIKHQVRSGESKILIPKESKQTKASIQKIMQKLDTPEHVISILLDVVDVNGSLYIRLKTK